MELLRGGRQVPLIDNVPGRRINHRPSRSYRFIHGPLSDFFVVYNEVRPTGGDAATLRGPSLEVGQLVSL